jgi:hypothetical protein
LRGSTPLRNFVSGLSLAAPGGTQDPMSHTSPTAMVSSDELLSFSAASLFLIRSRFLSHSVAAASPAVQARRRSRPHARPESLVES